MIQRKSTDEETDASPRAMSRTAVPAPDDSDADGGEREDVPPPAPPPDPAPAVSAEGLLPLVEALLFVAREPLTPAGIADAVGEEPLHVVAAIDALRRRYSGTASGVHLVEIAGGWRLLTNPACADAVARMAGGKSPDRLSPASLETLAIIAYKQPVSRAEIERIRGVGVGSVLRGLLDMDLIRVAGREEGLGRALLYGTTRLFLDRFGLGAVRDLPASIEI